jgi:hypothetical protein
MIVTEERGDVTVVRMARPPVNALDLDMIEALRASFERLEGRARHTGVVLARRSAPASIPRPSLPTALRSVARSCGRSRR